MTVDLPKADTLAGVAAAQARLIAEAAEGALAPEEAASLAAMLEGQRRTLETVEIEARLVRLEAQVGLAPP